jgi:hypothetical protein
VVDPTDADAVEVTHELEENVGDTVLVCEDVSDMVPVAEVEGHTDTEAVDEVDATATEGEIFDVVVTVVDRVGDVEIENETVFEPESEDVVV